MRWMAHDLRPAAVATVLVALVAASDAQQSITVTTTTDEQTAMDAIMMALISSQTIPGAGATHEYFELVKNEQIRSKQIW